jgi:hypothetical protein
MGHESEALKPLAVVYVLSTADRFLNSFLLFFRARARGTPKKPNAGAGFLAIKPGAELRLFPTLLRQKPSYCVIYLLLSTIASHFFLDAICKMRQEFHMTLLIGR